MKSFTQSIRPILILSGLFLSLFLPIAHAAEKQSNIVYILADDKN